MSTKRLIMDKFIKLTSAIDGKALFLNTKLIISFNESIHPKTLERMPKALSNVIYKADSAVQADFRDLNKRTVMNKSSIIVEEGIHTILKLIEGK